SSFVCFPMLGALADRLCPDPQLNQTDVEVSWRAPGGDAFAAIDGLECFLDPTPPLYATLIVHLSADLAGMMPRAPGGGEGPMVRKSLSIYDMVTRLVGLARAGGRDDASGGLYLSLFVANGSRLNSPWASQDFGPEMSDRLFDVASSAQTLALL